jgi:hypothetical protein
METHLFNTAFKRPNGEILPGEVVQLNDGAFKFHTNGSLFYYFVIEKDEQGKWKWVDGHSASLDRVKDLGEKIDEFLAR